MSCDNESFYLDDDSDCKSTFAGLIAVLDISLDEFKITNRLLYLYFKGLSKTKIQVEQIRVKAHIRVV